MRTGWFSQRTQPHANERNKISKESSGNWQPGLSDFLGEIPRGILWVVFSEGLRKTWYHLCSQMNTHSCFDPNNAYLRWTMLVAPVTVRIFHKCLSFRWTVPVSNNWQSCEGMQFFLKGPCMFWICIDRYCSCQLHLRQHFKSRLHCLNNDPHSRVAIESNQNQNLSNMSWSCADLTGDPPRTAENTRRRCDSKTCGAQIPLFDYTWACWLPTSDTSCAGEILPFQTCPRQQTYFNQTAAAVFWCSDLSKYLVWTGDKMLIDTSWVCSVWCIPTMDAEINCWMGTRPRWRVANHYVTNVCQNQPWIEVSCCCSMDKAISKKKQCFEMFWINQSKQLFATYESINQEGLDVYWRGVPTQLGMQAFKQTQAKSKSTTGVV